MVTIRSLKLECPIVAHCNVQNEHILPLWSHSVALGFDTCVCTRIKHPVRLLSYLLCFGWMVGCSTESKLLLLTLFVLCRVSMYMHGQGYAIRNILGNYQTFVQIYNSIFYYILLYIYTHVLHMFYHSVLYCSTLKSKYVTTQYLLVQLFHHFYLAAFLLLLLFSHPVGRRGSVYQTTEPGSCSLIVWGDWRSERDKDPLLYLALPSGQVSHMDANFLFYH